MVTVTPVTTIVPSSLRLSSDNQLGFLKLWASATKPPFVALERGDTYLPMHRLLQDY
jgi:hypothetical protein